jgi:hypothetical protein
LTAILVATLATLGAIMDVSKCKMILYELLNVFNQIHYHKK